MTDSSSWSKERVELLVTAWRDGQSASTISRQLNEMPGKLSTRSSVLGKLHRLGIYRNGVAPRISQPRPSRARQRPLHPSTAALRDAVKARSQMPAPDANPEPVIPIDVPTGDRVSLLMLNEKTCRWPMGDPASKEFFFCGILPQFGSSYCKLHHRIAYKAVQ